MENGVGFVYQANSDMRELETSILQQNLSMNSFMYLLVHTCDYYSS